MLLADPRCVEENSYSSHDHVLALRPPAPNMVSLSIHHDAYGDGIAVLDEGSNISCGCVLRILYGLSLCSAARVQSLQSGAIGVVTIGVRFDHDTDNKS